MKRGLILEGGAMRGLFTAGIIDVMMEHDLWPDGIVGVSAGAAFGCNYKSRQPGRAIRYNKRFAKDTLSLPTTSCRIATTCSTTRPSKLTLWRLSVSAPTSRRESPSTSP